MSHGCYQKLKALPQVTGLVAFSCIRTPQIYWRSTISSGKAVKACIDKRTKGLSYGSMPIRLSMMNSPKGVQPIRAIRAVQSKPK